MHNELTSGCPILKPGVELHRRGVSGVPGLNIVVEAVERDPANQGCVLVTDQLGHVHRLYVKHPKISNSRVMFTAPAESWHIDLKLSSDLPTPMSVAEACRQLDALNAQTNEQLKTLKCGNLDDLKNL